MFELLPGNGYLRLLAKRYTTFMAYYCLGAWLRILFRHC